MTKTESIPTKTKQHKIRSIIFRILLVTIAGLTVGLSVYSWNARQVFGNQLPMPFGFGASVVLSGSMEPTLKVNDLVFIFEQDDYQVDDIVVYQNDSELIIHRIIRVQGDQVVTQGDANNVSDDPINRDQIKGKYAFKIPFVGLVFKILKSLPGTLCILALVVFLLYRSRRKERKVGEEELDKIVAEIKALQAQQTADNNASVSTESTAAAREPSGAADETAVESITDEVPVVEASDKDTPAYRPSGFESVFEMLDELDSKHVQK